MSRNCLLALIATAALQCLNLLSVSGGGKQIYDLAGLFDNLRNRSYEPAVWWIYFTLFSTLLPTIVHAVAGVKSLLGWTFGKKQRRQFIVDIQDRTAVGEGNHMASVEIACAFARRDVLAWVLTGLGVALLLSLLFWGLPGLARALLFACEWLAQMLGANIVPGDILPMISPDIAPAIKQWLI